MALALVMVLSLAAVAGCGGGGEEGVDDGIDEIEFVDEPTPTGAPAVQVDVIAEFLQETVLVLPDMEYLDTQAFYLSELEEVARDVTSHIEGGQGDDVGLEWVVGVHRTVLRWDELQGVLAKQEVSVEHRERFAEIYVGMVEAYYRLAFSADRLLGAAVVLGPTGRSVMDMGLEEERRFRVLMNQAGYFAEKADEKVSEIRISVDSESFALGSR